MNLELAWIFDFLHLKLIQIIKSVEGITYQGHNNPIRGTIMTQPIPDKAEVALEYPDKLYIGTFERSARFDAHLDKTGISLTLQRMGDIEARRSIRMHLHYGLFAEILRELAKTVSGIPEDDTEHKKALRDAAEALHRALAAQPFRQSHKTEVPKLGQKGEIETSEMSPDEEVRLLHIME
jgi:hypothetical protein